MEQAETIVGAARRLIATQGISFTTQELVKEAGVALQTFYRYFDGKDQLLLAVYEALISEFCSQLRDGVAEMTDPTERLRYCVTIAARPPSDGGADVVTSRSIISLHWRLQQEYPAEVALAIGPFCSLLADEISNAFVVGVFATSDAQNAAWHITQLVMAVVHHCAFMDTGTVREEIAESLWRFCLSGLGGMKRS